MQVLGYFPKPSLVVSHFDDDCLDVLQAELFMGGDAMTASNKLIALATLAHGNRMAQSYPFDALGQPFNSRGVQFPAPVRNVDVRDRNRKIYFAHVSAPISDTSRHSS
jgi:hypothetical protein